MLVTFIQLSTIPDMVCLQMISVTLYREVHTLDDRQLLQNDLTNVSSWSQRWQLQLNWTKCEGFKCNQQTKPYIIFI